MSSLKFGRKKQQRWALCSDQEGVMQLNPEIYIYIYLYTFCISRSAKFHNSPGVGDTLGQLSWQMANEGWCNLFAHSDVQCHSKAALVTRALHG